MLLSYSDFNTIDQIHHLKVNEVWLSDLLHV